MNESVELLSPDPPFNLPTLSPRNVNSTFQEVTHVATPISSDSYGPRKWNTLENKSKWSCLSTFTSVFHFFCATRPLAERKKTDQCNCFFHQNSAKNSNGNFSETKHLLIQAFSTHPSWTCPKPLHFHEVFIIIPKKEGSDFYHTTNSNNDMFRSGTNQCPPIGRLSFIPWPDIKVCNFER